MCIYVANFMRKIYIFLLNYIKDRLRFYMAFLLQNSGYNIRKTEPNETRMSFSIAVKIERISVLVEGRGKSKSGTPRSFRARTIAPHQLHGCLINRVELFYDTGCATIIIYCTLHRYPCND